jgi:hypothetical protein
MKIRNFTLFIILLFLIVVTSSSVIINQTGNSEGAQAGLPSGRL